MNVVTCLPPSLVSRVRQACALTCTLHAAPSWNEALRLAHERDADVLVFEPTDAVTASDFASLVAAAPHVVLVGYASVSSAAVRATLALGQHESSRMIIRGIDDDPARLRHTLAQAMESSLAARIFDSISSDVARIPAPLALALDRMLRHPRRFLGVEDLAQSASLNRRALDRWLSRAGLSSARTLLACARAAGAWRALARRGVTLAAAAESLGVSERLLARDIRRATGSGARRLAKHTSQRELVTLLAGTMRPTPPSRDRQRASHSPGEGIRSGVGAGSDLWRARFLEVREQHPVEHRRGPGLTALHGGGYDPAMRAERVSRREQSDTSGGAFPPTRLTLVRELTSAEPAARERAIDSIAATYWKPIYTYLRLSWRLERDDAEDVTQEFFVRASEKGWFERYDPTRSRFRSWVRLCLDAFVANERRAQRRLKRGGNMRSVPLDFPGAERELHLARDVAPMDPEECFTREWMRAFFAAVVGTLREHATAEGKSVHFALFERYDLADDEARPTYAALAAAHGLPVTQVTNHLAWSRREFRRLVLERLRGLSGSDDEFRADVRELLGVNVR